MLVLLARISLTFVGFMAATALWAVWPYVIEPTRSNSMAVIIICMLMIFGVWDWSKRLKGGR